ncbi:ABC transporter substrate-binding protein [Maritimibacter alkaliphilus]|uniref:ABC transporter substrate-binding protein n=1 Tax=Maritimibacter alkaliphilus TaxID=404236 RepID=UPI0021BDC0C9|nr:ABC transporter substrate-binding protein [Maritimibacter alkaliphilus]
MLTKSFCSNLLKPTMLALALGTVSGAAVQAQTITAVMHAPLRAVDPVISTAYILRNFGYMIYDTPLALDSAGTPQPQMASWEVSEDGKTYTFTLRDGLTFHDGAPVTAEDVVASVTRWSKVDKTGQVMASLMTEMVAVDDKTWTMTFGEPTGIALIALSKPSGLAPFIMPASVAATPVSEPITSTIGSGPFKFVEEDYRPGVSATFAKFEEYVPREEPSDGMAGAKVVKVDEVVWTTMPDPMTSLNALMSGEIDFLEQTPHDLLPVIEGNPDISTRQVKKQGSQNLVRMNHTLPPFDNPKYREAVLLALGQQPMLDAQVGAGSDYSQACAAVFGCGSIYNYDYRADDIMNAHPEEAKAILDEVGYDGTPILLMHATDLATLNPQGPVIAAQLRDAGFTVDMVSMDWASVVARRASKATLADGGWNMFSTTNVLPDVANPIGFIGVAAGGDSAWFGWPDVPEIEELRMAIAQTADVDQQIEYAKKIDELVIDNGVMVPMGELFNVNAYSSKLTGLVESEAPVFWNVEKAE